jgi:hypothetical protein
VPGVEQEQAHAIDGAISGLQCKPPLDRLSIIRASLGFIAVAPAFDTRNDDVPGSQIAGTWERDLSQDPKRRVQARAEPTEQPRVSGIPDRLACRE